MTSLTSILQKGIQNEVPSNILDQCSNEDRVLVENILLIAQAELATLNLPSTTIGILNNKTIISCTLVGADARIGLESMRAIQAYSPARILDVKAQVQSGSLSLSIHVTDGTARISATELEVVRIFKRKRVSF